jgi:hypothetical protein
MVDGLAISHLDIYDRLMAVDGPLALDTFGPVVMRASGPARADRVIIGL